MAKVIEADQTIQQAIEQARATCEANGNNSGECAVAWDIVEEMQAAVAHRRAAQKPRTGFEQYCDERPGASECRIYDV